MATRREFLGASALAAALSAAGRSAQLKSIGVQLYTVRTVLPKNPAETLNAIRAIGYQEIEATFAGFDKIWPAVQASGLKPVSMHLDAKMVTQGGDDLKRAIDRLEAVRLPVRRLPLRQPGRPRRSRRHEGRSPASSTPPAKCAAPPA